MSLDSLHRTDDAPVRPVELLDTTLRDGRQKVLRPEDTLRVVDPIGAAAAFSRKSSELGVRWMDAGVPSAQDGGLTRRSVEAVAAAHADRPEMSVLAFVRGLEKEIDQAVGAVSHAARKGVAILVSLSDSHLVKYRGRLGERSKEDMLSQKLSDFQRSVGHAGELRRAGDIDDVFVYVEDATRMDPSWRADVASAMQDAGANVISLPDTLGVSDPEEYAGMFADMRERLGAERYARVLWSAHCHEDFGSGIANTMAAARTGLVDILEGTFGGKGPGEGLGNTDLNVIVHRLASGDPERLPPRLRTRLRGTQHGLFELNELASQALGRKIPDDAPIVGRKAQRQTGAGIHQDAVAKEQSWTEATSAVPETQVYTHDFTRYGVPLQRRYAVTRMSGKTGFVAALRERGIPTDGVDFDRAFQHAMRMAADLNCELSDGQLEAVAWDARHPEETRVLQADLERMSIDGAKHALRMRLPLLLAGEELSLQGDGDGEVAAFADALDRLLQSRFGVTLDIGFYKQTAETHLRSDHKRDAVVLADLNVQINGDRVETFGFDSNAVHASCKACLLAVNKWLQEKRGHRNDPS